MTLTREVFDPENDVTGGPPQLPRLSLHIHTECSNLPDTLMCSGNVFSCMIFHTQLHGFFPGIYMLVSVVVLINLLIAMMSDTYQRIQAQSDIEWKYGLAKLIRNMHRTTTTPSPLNLVTTWLMVFLRFCKQKGQGLRTMDKKKCYSNFGLIQRVFSVMQRKRPSLVQMMGLQSRSRVSPRTKVATKWLAKVKKGQVAPKGRCTYKIQQTQIQTHNRSRLSFRQIPWHSLWCT